MKEAVNAEAEWYWYDGWHITFNDDDIHAAMPAGVVDGDKVKLIVIFYKGGLNDE